MDEPMVARDEVEALLATRRELGDEYEGVLVQSFAARVEKALAARTDEAARLERTSAHEQAAGRIRQFVLGLVSLGVGVPVTIVPVVGTDGSDVALPVVALAWLGIVGVNVAHSRSLRPRRSTRRD